MAGSTRSAVLLQSRCCHACHGYMRQLSVGANTICFLFARVRGYKVKVTRQAVTPEDMAGR